MSIIEYIILALVLGIEAMIVMHGSAKRNKVALTRGLSESLVLGIVSAALLAVGMWAGGLLRFSPDNAGDETLSVNELWRDTDNLVYMGLMLLVAVRLLLKARKKSREVPPYDISKWSTLLMLSVVVGMNVLIVGLALGFRVSWMHDLWRGTVPVAVIFALMSFLGVMLGRQEVAIRAQRWTLIAALFVLVFAVKVVLWG